MAKYRFWAIIIIAAAIVGGYFIWNSESGDSSHKFKLGLDLSGGTHLVYKAITDDIAPLDIPDSMQALRDTIERRINLFGVSEPLIQVEQGGVLGGNAADQRLIVELPGITDVNQAIKLIGQTPTLEFKLLHKADIPTDTNANLAGSNFLATGLTGKMLKRADIQFNSNTVGNKPIIGLTFNDQGKDLFAKITRDNIGDVLGIFLDGELIEAPFIKEEIPNGQAVITGNFTGDQAKEIVRNLNYGALPVPISLIGTQTIGPTLGEKATHDATKAGILAFAIVAAFLFLWYRLPGFVAILGLSIYTILNLILFKLIPVTLTAAGIAGFILSLGMAVDANILIFERMKEELKKGKDLSHSMEEGFKRAWTSIRDSNLSSIITAVILYYFASTPVIKGFALVFLIGVLVSMFSAITASRSILFALSTESKQSPNKFRKFLFGSGFMK